MTFYRLHNNADAPKFSADHAYSGLWGGTFNATGSHSLCRDCDGERQVDGEDCRTCDATGWEPAQYGYSACWSAADLRDYVNKHVGSVIDKEPVVVIFDGMQVGTGFDGEPLAVPTGNERWITWAELVKLADAEEN